VFNSTFAQVNGTLPPGAFTDPDLPQARALSGIQNRTVSSMLLTRCRRAQARRRGRKAGFVNVSTPPVKLPPTRCSQEKAQLSVGLALALLTSDSLAATCSSEFGDGKIMPSTPVISTATASIRSVASSTPRRAAAHHRRPLGARLAAAPLPAGRGIALLTAGPGGEKHGCSARCGGRHLSIGTRLDSWRNSRNARVRSP